MSWRRRAHEWGIIFCSAFGVYLLATLLAARVAPWVAGAIRGWDSLAGRIVVGIVALDLTRAPVLLLAAWVAGRSLTTSPRGAAVTIVLLTYLFELAVALILGQAGWLFLEPAVLLCRLAAAALLVWLTAWTLKRRRRTPPR